MKLPVLKTPHPRQHAPAGWTTILHLLWSVSPQTSNTVCVDTRRELASSTFPFHFQFANVPLFWAQFRGLCVVSTAWGGLTPINPPKNSQAQIFASDKQTDEDIIPKRCRYFSMIREVKNCQTGTFGKQSLTSIQRKTAKYWNVVTSKHSSFSLPISELCCS